MKLGGSERIRTSDTLADIPVFKTGALNHYATLPYSMLLLVINSASAERNAGSLSNIAFLHSFYNHTLGAFNKYKKDKNLYSKTKIMH